VSRPGTSSSAESHFVSPFQPPSGAEDMAADLRAVLDPEGWNVIHVAGHYWRVRHPNADALAQLNEIMDHKGGEQIQAINAFLARHLHPEDMSYMLFRMTDPDDSFSSTDYQALYRQVVTCGTARPFWLCSDWSGPPRRTGEPSGRDSH
jgi:hypothetical protein